MSDCRSASSINRKRVMKREQNVRIKVQDRDFSRQQMMSIRK